MEQYLIDSKNLNQYLSTHLQSNHLFSPPIILTKIYSFMSFSLREKENMASQNNVESGNWEINQNYYIIIEIKLRKKKRRQSVFTA